MFVHLNVVGFHGSASACAKSCKPRSVDRLSFWPQVLSYAQSSSSRCSLKYCNSEGFKYCSFRTINQLRLSTISNVHHVRTASVCPVDSTLQTPSFYALNFGSVDFSKFDPANVAFEDAEDGPNRTIREVDQGRSRRPLS